MEIKYLKNCVSSYITNIQGWRTNRKIVVIESDDWGSIRMPSKEIYYKCLRAGYPVDQIAYERYDSILSQDDLELLFNLLAGFRDINGNHPVLTANCVVANPDFNKIKKNGYKNYYYELITETFKKYPKHVNNFQLWNEAMKRKIFFPQYHAREHLNVKLFIDALLKGESDVHFGFNNQMPGCIPHGIKVQPNKYVEATNYTTLEDKEQKLAIYLEGLDLFETLFGYRSKTVIPPNYIWSPDYNEPILKKGVVFFQGTRKTLEPILEGKKRYHSSYLGMKNNLGQIYLVRNAIFEPSLFKLEIKDPVNRCLFDMSIAFKMQHPVVITSHRINYVGFIDETNRDKNLKMLQKLLQKALKKWPDIEFLNSEQLGTIINHQ